MTRQIEQGGSAADPAGRRPSTTGARPEPQLEPVTDCLGSNLCSIPPGPCSASTPGSRAAATAWSVRGRGRLRAVACGVIRTDPGDALPARLAALLDELRRWSPSSARRRWSVERVLFQDERAHRDLGRAGERARARRRGARRGPGRPLQPERGEARGHRRRAAPTRRRCRDGGAVARTCARSRSPADAGRRARARVLSRLWRAPLAAAGGGTRDRLGARDGASSARPSGEVLVEVGGVGYRVLVPLSARSGPRSGAPAFLFTHLHVREDAMVLYGFPTRDERDTFEALIGATGVGPKLALAILSVHTPGALRRCLADDDLDALDARARRRQAHRAAAARRAQGAPRGARPRPRRGPGAPTQRRAREVREALDGLGYSPEEVRDVARPARRRRHGRRAPPRRAALLAVRRDAMREELLSPAADPVEAAEETTLRPRRLDEFVGQPRLREHLEIMLGAATRARPGGRPRAARRAARPRQDDARRHHRRPRWASRCQPTSGPALERAGDLAAILTNLDDGDVLFIDEIHRLPRPVEEVLYPAMEDFQLDIVIGKGPSARTIRLDLPALHARRRDDAHRPDHRTACATASASSPGSTTTSPTSSPRSSAACRADPRRRARRRGRERDRVAGRAARRASRTGC